MMIHFDGLYCCIRDRVNYCLRFFEDGTVISASVGGHEGKPAFPRAFWFNPSGRNVSRGRYRADGDLIAFIAESADGRVEYVGEIGEDRLILNTHSCINDGWTYGQAFVFRPFSTIPAWDAPAGAPPVQEDDDHDDDNRSQDQY